MARMLTEEEVKRLEEQRGLQERARAATAPRDLNAEYNRRMEAAHAAAMERQRGYIERNPSAETDTTLRHQVLREKELDAANRRQMAIMGTEDVTRIEEARQKRQGMAEQGMEAARIRAQADKDMLGLNLGDKKKQRQHELGLLGQTQTFQGAQNDAERRNRLDIAGVQGQSAVEAARAQAEARAADISAKNEIEREKIAARKEIAAMRENGKLTQAGTARLSKTYGGLVAAGYSPARIRALLLDEGWSAEDIAAAQGRGQGLGQ